VPGLLRLVDLHVGAAGGLEGVEDRLQHLVLHPDQVERAVGGLLVDGRHGRHRVADVADAVRRERVLVRRPDDDAEGDRHLGTHHGGVHPGERLRLTGIDGYDAGVRVGRPEDLAVQHPREGDVVGVACAPGALGEAVRLPLPRPDHPQIARLRLAAPMERDRLSLVGAVVLLHGDTGSRDLRLVRRNTAARGPKLFRTLAHRSAPSSRIRSAAISTASRILV
jgi:hypothetical protein